MAPVVDVDFAVTALERAREELEKESAGADGIAAVLSVLADALSATAASPTRTDSPESCAWLGFAERLPQALQMPSWTEALTAAMNFGGAFATRPGLFAILCACVVAAFDGASLVAVLDAVCAGWPATLDGDALAAPAVIGALVRLDWAVRRARTPVAERRRVAVADLSGLAATRGRRAAASWAFVRWEESPTTSVVVARGQHIECTRLLRDPQMATLRGFVSPDEAKHIIKLACPQLHPSRVVSYDATGDTGVASAARTSESCKVVACADQVVKRCVQRAAFLTGLSPQHSEAVQVVHYRPGAEYRAHHDWFSPRDARFEEKTAESGNRLVSFFVYLADCEAGGHTSFPVLKRSFEPRVGDAVCWFNVDRAGRRDERTLHAGEPILRGEKWGMNVWLRQRPKRRADKAEADCARGGAGESGPDGPVTGSSGGGREVPDQKCGTCGDRDMPLGLCLCASKYVDGGGSVSPAVKAAVKAQGRASNSD